MPIEHIQPESHEDFKDRREVSRLCAVCKVRLFQIMGQLDEIVNILDAIDIPELSCYKKILHDKVEEKEEEVAEVVKSPIPSTSFKPPTKQDLASIAMTLARNLELNLKKE